MTHWAVDNRVSAIPAGLPTDGLGNQCDPHVSGQIALVHNGIIENYLELKNQLIKEGHLFSSETDSEIVAHSSINTPGSGLGSAVRKTLEDIKGSYALVILHKKIPGP